MKNDEQRILLSKLRISNHNLEIERGRHRGLQAKERMCILCLKEVEDDNNFDKYSESCNRLRDNALSTVVYLIQIYNYY
jgi:hypothetical protein